MNPTADDTNHVISAAYGKAKANMEPPPYEPSIPNASANRTNAKAQPSSKHADSRASGKKPTRSLKSES